MNYVVSGLVGAVVSILFDELGINAWIRKHIRNRTDKDKENKE